MYRIEYKQAARKALQRMPRPVAQSFLLAFERLAEDPSRRDLDVKPLAGRPGFRLRVDTCRALYAVEMERLLILVVDIRPRGDVYK
jgi:mRNA interferase RelE/StbE